MSVVYYVWLLASTDAALDNLTENDPKSRCHAAGWRLRAHSGSGSVNLHDGSGIALPPGLFRAAPPVCFQRQALDTVPHVQDWSKTPNVHVSMQHQGAFHYPPFVSTTVLGYLGIPGGLPPWSLRLFRYLLYRVQELRPVSGLGSCWLCCPRAGRCIGTKHHCLLATGSRLGGFPPKATLFPSSLQQAFFPLLLCLGLFLPPIRLARGLVLPTRPLSLLISIMAFQVFENANQGANFVITLVTMPICALVTIIRFAVIMRSGRKMGLEDWFAFAALFPYLAWAVYGLVRKLAMSLCRSDLVKPLSIDIN